MFAFLKKFQLLLNTYPFCAFRKSFKDAYCLQKSNLSSKIKFQAKNVYHLTFNDFKSIYWFFICAVLRCYFFVGNRTYIRHPLTCYNLNMHKQPFLLSIYTMNWYITEWILAISYPIGQHYVIICILLLFCIDQLQLILFQSCSF